MNDFLRPLGSTGLEVSALCIGTSPLASMPGLYGYEVGVERAVATVEAVFDSAIRFLDTSNGYGADGESERRIGEAIRRRGGLPDDFVLASKVDPDPLTGDFSGARVLASFEESLDRLGVERLQLLHLHDPERIDFDEAMAPGGAVEALLRLKADGRVDHLGVAGGDVDLMRRYIRTGAFEVVLNHNRFTLVDQSAEPLIAEAAELGVAFINAAPYGGGMLVKGPAAQPKYSYATADADIVGRVTAMQEVCARYGVPLAAVALQFSIGGAGVASTTVGVSAPDRVQQTRELASLPIPEQLWQDLAPLIHP
jgi:D-threo-aldose 1-dehydrogenase